MITTNIAADSIILRVVGGLKGTSVQSLERRWRRAKEEGDDIRLDLRATVEIDELGRRLISEMFADGVELVIGTNRPARVQ